MRKSFWSFFGDDNLEFHFFSFLSFWKLKNWKIKSPSGKRSQNWKLERKLEIRNEIQNINIGYRIQVQVELTHTNPLPPMKISNFHLPSDLERFPVIYSCFFSVAAYFLLQFLLAVVDHFSPLVYNNVLHRWPLKDMIKRRPKVRFYVRPYRASDGPQIRKIWTSGFLDMCNDATFNLGTDMTYFIHFINLKYLYLYSSSFFHLHQH